MRSPADEAFAQALAALQAGQVENAERLFKQTLRLDAGHVPALNVYGVVLTQMQRYEEAEEYVRRAIQKNASSDATFYNYGVILKALKRYDEAIEQFDRAVAINGSVPDTFNTRGDVYFELDQPEKALADFDKAISLNPQFVDALVNKARAMPKEDAAAALRLTEQALAIQPNHALAWLARGNLLNEVKRYDDAIPSFERALAAQPDLSQARLGHGDALRKLGQFTQAIEVYEKALAEKPDLAAAYDALGLVFLELGRIDDAERSFRKAIHLDPTVGGVFFNLATAKKFSVGDPDIVAMESLAASEKKNISKSNRALLDFALGRAYADSGDHRRSFHRLLAANAAHRSTLKYDEVGTVLNFQRIEKVFTRELIAAKSGGSQPSPRPIFIIGMPRSGSTLLEQILSSHPSIAGVGEVPAFSDALRDVLVASATPDAQPSYPESVPSLSVSAISAIGEKYLVRLAQLAPEKEHATDKMLSNFLYAGLIHLALPNAIILHTARNALDTCISCFSLKFTDHHPYSYDLAELGRYYRLYQHLMQHWHAVLPQGRILDVQYEDVVSDLEGQARRVIAHCGLPWDDRCLTFHKNDRVVRTASLTQVRQPIYKTSVNRWREYEEFLGPLLKELEIDPHATE